MRALSLTQPWCGLVGSGIKLVENRPRAMIRQEDFGKTFALHASREIDESVYDRIEQIAPELRLLPDIITSTSLAATRAPEWYRLSRITSAVIAVAVLDGVVETKPPGLHVRHWADRMSPFPEEQRRWFFGPIGYVLRDVRALLTPVPCRGWQGFWRLTPKAERERGEVSAVERAVVSQLARAS